MSLNLNFKEEYYELLKKCLLLVEKSNRYEAVCKEYKALRNEINRILEDTDALCSYSERLIDKYTGKTKQNAESVIGSDSALMNMLTELGELYIEKHSFAEFGWSDEVKNHIDVVLAIGAY